MAILQVLEISPQDTVDAIKSLGVRQRTRSDWLTEWLPEEQMLAWAMDSLSRDDERGNADALTWAKRAVCARIDRYLTLCLLSKVVPREYPSRIEILRAVGIDIPNVVYDLVIEPRNDLEHLYCLPQDRSAAKHAVEIARLSLEATKACLKGRHEERRCGCVVLNWNMPYSAQSDTLQFHGFADEPMVFVDVFEEPVRVQIVDPADGEIRFAFLSRFDKQKVMELCILLNRWSGSTHNRQEIWQAPGFLKAAKEALKSLANGLPTSIEFHVKK